MGQQDAKLRLGAVGGGGSGDGLGKGAAAGSKVPLSGHAPSEPRFLLCKGVQHAAFLPRGF